MKPKVSVIVPIYKVERYLQQCVDSIRNQTLLEIEIILVDDGSPDRCPLMCDQFAQEDDRIRVIHQENAGVSVARNRGIDEATADWIMFVDSDDWLELDAVEVLYQIALETNDDIICGAFYRETPKGQVKDKLEPPEKEYLVEQNISFFLGCVVFYYPSALGYPWGKLYKRKILVSNKLQFISGLKRRQDTVFNLYAIRYAKQIYVISTPIYHYRIWNESACNKLFSDQEKIFYNVHSEMYLFMENHQLWKEFYSYYNFVVVDTAYEFFILYARSMDNLGQIHTAAATLKKLCAEDRYRNAIKSTRLSFIPRRKLKIALTILKLHMYKTLLLICCVYDKLFKKYEK